jgi:hypothetical protein
MRQAPAHVGAGAPRSRRGRPAGAGGGASESLENNRQTYPNEAFVSKDSKRLLNFSQKIQNVRKVSFSFDFRIKEDDFGLTRNEAAMSHVRMQPKNSEASGLGFNLSNRAWFACRS